MVHLEERIPTMLKKRFVLGVALSGVVVISLLLIAAISPQANNGKHCYAMLSPVDPDSNGSSQILESGCYDTFSESIQAATKGRVNLDQSVLPKDVTDSILNQGGTSSLLAPDTLTVIGIDYKDASFGGDSYAWTTSYSGCSDTISFGVSTMPSGWDNVVSSARAFANCNHYYHWENTSYSGANLDCGSSCSSMGVMNNQTSSEQWHQ